MAREPCKILIVLYVRQQSPTKQVVVDEMWETPGGPVNLEHEVENLFAEVARGHLWGVRFLDGWNALSK